MTIMMQVTGRSWQKAEDQCAGWLALRKAALRRHRENPWSLAGAVVGTNLSEKK
jgi:hypothetical protein